MEPFTRLTSIAIPLPGSNIDTDVIFPARFLLITAKTGLKPEDAYMLCSLKGDLHITQTVDGNKGVHCMMEKSMIGG